MDPTSKRAILGAYGVAFVAMLYPLVWDPSWEIGSGIASSIHSIPWSSSAVRTTFLAICVLTVAGGMGGLAYHVGRTGWQWPQKVKINGLDTLNLGWVGDAFLGVVAANALHFPLSSMVAYDNLTVSGKAAQAWLALFALGILGGYAGGVLLKRWSDSLVATMAKEIKENKRISEEALGNSISLRNEMRREEDHILLRAVDEAVTTKNQLDMTAAALLDRRAKEAKEIQRSEGLDALGSLDALFAAYNAYRQKDYQDAIELLNHSLGKGLEVKYEWAALSLLGLSYHYQSGNGWFEKAKGIYERAAKKDYGIVPSAIIAVNYGFLLLEGGLLDEAGTQFEHALSKASQLKGNPLVLDVALLGKAAVQTAIFLKRGGDEGAAASEVKALFPKIENSEKIRYIITDESIPEEILLRWKTWGADSKFLP